MLPSSIRCCSEYQLHPCVVASNAFERQTKLKSHILYCDFALNTEHNVYLNIFQNFVLTAMKMHRYIRNWGINANKSSDFIKGELFVPSYVILLLTLAKDCIRQMVHYAYAAIKSKASNKVARSSDASCDIQKVHVTW